MAVPFSDPSAEPGEDGRGAGRQGLFPWLLLVLLLALGVRCFRLTHQSLWTDEGLSVHFASGSLEDSLAIVGRDYHPPLYFLLLNRWLDVFGSSEEAVRGLSVLAGSLAVLAVFLLGRRLSGNPVGLAAALIASLSLYQVYYSQEARAYALVAALSAVAMERHLAFVQRPTASRAGTLALADLLLIYVHYFGFFVLLVQALHGASEWLRGRFRPRVVTVLGVVVTVAAGFSIWVPTLLRQFSVVRSGFWMSAPTPLDLLTIWPTLLLYRLNWWNGLHFCVALALLAGWTWWRRGRTIREAGPRAGVSLLLTWLLLPVLVSYGLSLLDIRVFHRRSLMVAAPALYVLLAIVGSGPGWRRWVLPVVLAASLACYGGHFDRIHKHNFRAAVNYVKRTTTPGDEFLLDPIYLLGAFEYYFARPYTRLETGEEPTAAQVFAITPRQGERWRPALSAFRSLGYQVADRQEFRALVVHRLVR